MTDRPASVALVSARGDRPHLTLAGELDAQGLARFQALLEDEVAPGAHLSLDLSRVTRVSAEALALLVHAYRRQRDSGGTLVLTAASDAVVRTLRVSGLHRVLAAPPTPARPAAPTPHAITS